MTRLLMGVVAPATNITVQPECEALRPRGVINAHARIPNRDRPVRSDADTLAVRAEMLAGLAEALDTLSPARPGHVLLGVMVENFAGGAEAGAALLREAEARVGCPVTDVSSSLLAALDALFPQRPARVALLTPFMPVGDAAARALFAGAGHDVLAVTGLKAPSPAAIAALPDGALRAAIADLAALRPDAILQLGTNLPFATLAEEATAELGLPVLASNPVAYWRALRRSGIADPLPGSLARLP